MLWDGNVTYQTLSLEYHSEQVASISISPDNSHLVSCSYDGAVCLWDMPGAGACTTDPQKTPKLLTQGTSPRVNRILFSPDGTCVALGRSDGSVQLWDMSAEKVTRTLQGRASVSGPARIFVAFSPDGTQIISTVTRITYGANYSAVCNIGVWDSATGEQLRTLSVDHDISCARVTANGHHVIIRDLNGGDFRFWDIASDAQYEDALKYTAICSQGRPAFYSVSDIREIPQQDNMTTYTNIESIPLQMDGVARPSSIGHYTVLRIFYHCQCSHPNP